MQEILWVLDKLIENFTVVYIAVAAMLFVFGVVNFSTDPYRKDSKKIIRATKLLGKDKESFGFVAELPYQYRYMWQVFALGKNVYPRDVFRFVKNKQRRYGIALTAAAVIFSLIIAVASVARGNIDPWLICGGAGFAVCFGAFLVGIKLKESAQVKRASLLLARFICCMDAVFGKNDGQVKAVGEIDENATNELIDKIKFLRENGLPCVNAQKIASLLSTEKLSQPRTVEQQKKLNAALNGLVQVMSYTMRNQGL